MKKRNLPSSSSLAIMLALSIAAAMPVAAPAQNSMSPNSMSSPNSTEMQTVPQAAEVTIVAKIKSINTEERQVTLVTKDGTETVVDAGPEVRLDMLKKGDKVTAQYYRSVAFALSTPGATVPEDQMTQMIAKKASAPGGIGVKVTRISGLVVGIDMASNSVQIVDPSGGLVHTVIVTDPSRIAMLPQLQVGTTVTAVVSEMLAVSIQPAPKGLF
jgi:hypothetical protein